MCELSGCDEQRLVDIDTIRTMLIEAAKVSRATIMESAFHRFQPQGVSGTVILAESHLAIHTWPEKGYAAMDFYTCGDHTDPWLACEYAAKALGAKAMRTTEIKRGIESGEGNLTHIVTRDENSEVLTA